MADRREKNVFKRDSSKKDELLDEYRADFNEDDPNAEIS